MRSLVIIGNGFDLAHELKTGYHDFIGHIEHSIKSNSESLSEFVGLNNIPNINKDHILYNDLPNLFKRYKNKTFKNPNDFFQKCIQNIV